MVVTTTLRGEVNLAGDKSLSHRAIMYAAMARGKSTIHSLANGIDVNSTRRVFEQLSVDFADRAGALVVNSRGLRCLKAAQQRLDCGNSGTTLRLALGILAGSSASCILEGDESLNRRPIKRVIEPLALMGADCCTEIGGDSPPVIVKGRRLRGIDYLAPVASAQVKSAVLLAALHAEGITRYREPALSRDHTERFLAQQGVDLEVTTSDIVLTPSVELKPFEYQVPGDSSTAANFIVAATLLPGSELRLRDILLNQTRTAFLDILRAMGAKIKIENEHEEYGEPTGDLIVSGSNLRGVNTSEFVTPQFIDEIPILAVAAAFAEGSTTIRNAAELRVKESDRMAGIVEMLAAYGVKTELAGDDLIVTGDITRRSAQPDHHGDHRLAMAIEIMNLLVDGQVSGEYQDVISISAPEFYRQLAEVIR